MTRLFFIFGALLLLEGCAQCQVETFFKASSLMPSSAKLTDNNRLYISSEQPVQISFFECGTAYRERKNTPVSICFELKVNEGTVVSLDPSSFDFLSTDGKKLGMSSLVTSTLLFPGGREVSAPLMSRILVPQENWKTYYMSLTVPSFSETQFLLVTPQFYINGKPWQKFKLRFQLVTEEVCVMHH